MLEHFLAAWARFLTRRPRASLALLVLLTAGAGVAIRSFRVDPDVGALLPRDHEGSQLLRRLQERGLGPRTAFLALRGEQLEERLPEVLASLERSPWLESVVGDRESWIAARAAGGGASLHALPPESLAALEERLTSGRRAALEATRESISADPLAGAELARRDPLGLRWVLAELDTPLLPESFDPRSPFLLLDEGRLALVMLVGAREPYDVEFSNALLADVEARTAGLDATVLGGYRIARGDAARIRSDLVSSILWSVPLIVLFLTLSTRSFWMPHLFVVPTAVAVFWGLAYGGWILGPLNPLAVSTAAILTGLGVDFGIHYVGRFQDERRARGYAESVERAHARTGRALATGMATSVAAFLTTGLGSFEGLRGFGLLLALGLVLALFATLSLTPLFLRVLPRLPEPARPGPLLRAFAALHRGRGGRAAAFLCALVAAAGWTLAATRGLRFDADPAHLRPPEERFAAQAAELEEHLGFSPVAVLALVPSDISIDALDAATERLEREGHVAFASGPQDVLPTAASRARLDSFRERTRGWVEAALADARELGLVPEALRPTLESQARLFATDAEVDPAAMQVPWRGAPHWKLDLHPPRSLSDRGLRTAFHAELERALPPGTSLVDPFGLSDELAPLLEKDLLRASLLSGLVVLVVVLLGVGSARDALFALAPVLCALGITLGYLALSGTPVHPGNFIAIPLVLGLGVDAGVHMVLRAREGELRLVETTGVAVWRTSVTTCLGFGSLVTAASPAIASLGAVVLVGTLASFLASVLVVPALVARR